MRNLIEFESQSGGSPNIPQVAISPDGRRIAYVRFNYDLQAGIGRTSIWLVSAQGGQPSRILRDWPEANSLQWSRDGRTLGFLAPHIAKQQVWLWNVGSNVAKVVTSAPTGVTTFAISPDGRNVATVQPDPPNASQRYLASIKRDEVVIEPQEGQVLQSQALRQVWVTDIASGKSVKLTRDSWSCAAGGSLGTPSWSRDGKRMAVFRQPSAMFNDFGRGRLVTIDLASRQVTETPFHYLGLQAGAAGPVYGSPNTIAYVGSWDGGLPSREDVFINGRDISRGLDRTFWDSSSIAWTGDGTIIGIVPDGLSARLYEVFPDGRMPRALTARNKVIETFSASSMSNRIAAVETDSTHPAEVYVLSTTSNSARQVTHLFMLPKGIVVTGAQRFTWQNSAGQPVEGLLYRPASNKPAPLIVNVHGGPQYSSTLAFDVYNQYLVSKGYAIFEPNFRGSWGYGDAWDKAIVGDWIHPQFDDVMSGVDALEKAGVADGSRLFVVGFSGGGFLTAWIVGHTDRFRAAVSGEGPDDLPMFGALSDDESILDRYYGSRPLENAFSKLQDDSAAENLEKEHTPVLILAGADDTRVPVAEDFMLFKKLVARGVDTQLVIYPREGHDMSNEPQHVLSIYYRIAHWFQQHGGLPLHDAIPDR